MLVTEIAKTVTNILTLSPTHFVSNIRHQHRCSQFENKVKKKSYRRRRPISLNSNCNIFPKMISFLVFCQFLVSSTFLPFSQLSTFDLKIFIWPETFLQNKINIFLFQIWKNSNYKYWKQNSGWFIQILICLILFSHGYGWL